MAACRCSDWIAVRRRLWTPRLAAASDCSLARLVDFAIQFLGQPIDFLLGAAKRFRFVAQHAFGGPLHALGAGC